MKKTTLFYMINLMYMEFIFHFYFWHDVKIALLPSIAVIFVFACVQSLIQGLFKGKGNTICFGIFMAADYLLFASQLVYRSIFKQPLMIKAILYGGGDALTNYWREALQGIWAAMLGLIALALGIVWSLLVTKLLRQERAKRTMKRIGVFGGMFAVSVGVLYLSLFGMYRYFEEAYKEYQEFGYPDEILERFGVTSFWVRDAQVLYLPETEEVFLAERTDQAEMIVTSENITTESIPAEKYETVPTETTTEGESTATEQLPTEHTLDVDIEYLKEIGSDQVDKITDYVCSIQPTTENAYTGMFEDYNLIFITAEGFSTAAVDENLTPTLYQLVNSGIVAQNYYVPLWQTSTSDGEYANLMGLIPDQQFSMKRSAENALPYSLAHYFQADGAVCYAYHNNSLSYYDRHLSHTNLGYFFKAAKLGNLKQSEWGDHVFQMEHPDYWPASDLEMMQATVSEYINEDRFHVYYLTVSGHMNYNFSGNRMASIHQQEVSTLPYSEEGKAYIACNIELDRALEYLIEQLKAAGKLEKTVICLSADHYPYAMQIENYEELMGASLENSLELYRNSLILWNSEMETITVEKPCCSLDLMPTLLNLFGFDYDSRLFSGRDIFSDQEGLVVFANKSFITDTVSYNKKTGEVVQRTDVPVSEEYIQKMKSYVDLLYKHAAGILNENYYAYFSQALEEE